MNYFLKKMDELGNPPQSIPILAQTNEHIPQICGLPYDYLFRDDPVAMAECTLLVWEYYDLNLVVANLDCYNFEAESIGQEVNFFPQNIPDVNRSNFLIKDESDFKKITFNGLESGRFPYLVEYIKATKKYIDAVPPQNMCAPWSLACNIYGLENLIIACYEKPQFVHGMMNALVDSLCVPMYAAFIETFPDMPYWQLADAWASPPMTNMKIISEFIEPYYKRLNDEIGSHGVVTDVVGLWGFTGLPKEDHNAFAQYLVTMGGRLTAMDPDPEEIGVEWFNRYAVKNDVPLTLGLMSSLLQTGSQEVIVDRVNRYLTEGTKDSAKLAFIFNTIAPTAPSENVHMAVAAIKAFEAGEKADCKSLAHSLTKPSFEDFVRGKMEHNDYNYAFDWIAKSSLNL